MIFQRELGFYRNQYAENGYVHIKDILTAEFLGYLVEFHKTSMVGRAEEYVPGFVEGKKRQYLFDFASSADAFEFRDQIAALTGADPEKVAVSERHLKQYDEQAKAFPAPHKDRGASRISVGLPIHLGPKSTVCLFPKLDRSNNDRESALYLEAEDGADPISLYQDGEAVFLHESVGDLIVFEGSSLFHERTQPAGTAIVYIKLNDRGLDPLGENIYDALSAVAAGQAPETARPQPV
jgi:hypothetical protein